MLSRLSFVSSGVGLVAGIVLRQSDSTQLRDQAVAELKLTTAGWRKPNGNLNYPTGVAPMTTHWGKAMALLSQITDGSGFGSGAWGG